MKNIVVTGGAGFIGLNFVKYILENTSFNIHVIDNFTYASNYDALVKTKVPFTKVDIADRQQVSTFFANNKVDTIIHFAAESHVDNSIKNCMPFVHSNIIGTINLLDMAVLHNVEKFVHISTDEVFGEVPYPGKFNEYSNIVPRNPYSSSKAAAEHFVQSYHNTYGIPYVIINSSNNYGPYQNSEKLIPLTINNLLNGKNVPVYGNGNQVRDWLFVWDTVDIIHRIFTNGSDNTRYCIGGDNETVNLDLVKMILSKLNLPESRIEFVKDRPGHDTRYATDITKVKNEFNWVPSVNLDNGLDLTIEWIKNENRI